MKFRCVVIVSMYHNATQSTPFLTEFSPKIHLIREAFQ